MQTKQCPHCGAIVPINDAFCGECGKPVAILPPQPPVTSVPPPAPASGVSGLLTPDNFAIASLVLSVIGLCTFWLLCGVIPSLAAMGLAVPGLKGRLRIVAIIGLVLGVIGLILTAVSFAVGFAQGFAQGLSGT